jgi:YfiH family protein
VAIQIQTEEFIVYFGHRGASGDVASLREAFPDLNFCLVNQVHGDRIVQAGSAMEDADGHFTDIPQRALVIQSADCLPLLFCSDRRVMAVHAGWRGVLGGIVARAADQALAAASDWRVFIGPHIRWESFEVGLDVSERLLGVRPPETSSLRYTRSHAEADKVYFNLTQLAIDHLIGRGFTMDQITDLGHDTLTDATWASFRRDKHQAGRNLSFVALKRSRSR